MTERVAVVFGFVASVVVACRAAQQTAPPAPPILQEPQTIMLWPGGAPGAQGAEDRDKPALTIYMPPNTTGPMTAVIVAPGGGYRHAVDEPRRACARQLLQYARCRRLRPAVPARTAIPPSDRARRRAACRPDGARSRGGMAHRPRPHRVHGLLGRRPSRVHRVDPFRQRQRERSRSHRSREQPARLRHPRLSGHFAHRTVDPPGVEAKPARARLPIPRWRAASPPTHASRPRRLPRSSIRPTPTRACRPRMR